MTLTKEYLEGELAELQRNFDKVRLSAETINGAIQLAQHLLEVLEQPEPQQQASAPGPPGNLVEFPKRETSPPIGEPS